MSPCDERRTSPNPQPNAASPPAALAAANAAIWAAAPASNARKAAHRYAFRGTNRADAALAAARFAAAGQTTCPVAQPQAHRLEKGIRRRNIVRGTHRRIGL